MAGTKRRVTSFTNHYDMKLNKCFIFITAIKIFQPGVLVLDHEFSGSPVPLLTLEGEIRLKDISLR